MNAGSVTELEQRIRAVFPIEPVPSHLVPDLSHPEYVLIQNEFQGRNWPNISDDELLRNSATIHLFSQEGFAYFLPAYLCRCLRPEADMVLISTVSAFTVPPEEPKTKTQEQDRRWQLERIGTLTADQREVAYDVLATVLKTYRDEYERDDAAQILSALKQVNMELGD